MTDIINKATALIDRLAGFHTDTLQNGTQVICLDNTSEIAEALHKLFMDDYAALPQHDSLVEELVYAASIGALTIHPSHTDEQGGVLARLHALAKVKEGEA